MKDIILDVDTGIDDALAIAYAVKSTETNIVAITTCFGNVSVEEATRNTLQVLEVLGDTETPVVPGVNKPMERDHLKGHAKHVHGDNGLGGVDLPKPTATPVDQFAVDYLIESFRKFPQKITYIALGSLTNLALAIKKDPEIINLVERVVVMGGAVTVPGNVNSHAEANIYTDPEAADYVFQSGIPLTLVGLDVTLKTLLTRNDVANWRERNTAYTTFLADISQFYIDFYTTINRLEGCALHDPLAVGVVIDPSFVQTKAMNIRVDVSDEFIGKTYEATESASKIDVCLDVDASRFTAHFLETLTK